VTVVLVHVLYCDSGTCTCFVLWQWYLYMFCTVTMVLVNVLYCDDGTPEKSLKSTALVYLLFYVLPQVKTFKLRDCLHNLVSHS